MNDTPTPAAPIESPVGADAAQTLPDRLCTDPRSPHFVASLMQRDIGVRFNGKDRFDIEEYCVSEGWVKVAAGKTVDRHGRPVLIKLKGAVEVFFRAPA